MCFQRRVINFDKPEKVNQRLFKFYPIKDYHIAAFQQHILFFSHPSKLNDCFDTSSRLIEPYKEFKRRVNWSSDMAKVMDNHGICSFIEAADVKSERMWTFYADSFNGFAIEFDSELLKSSDYAPIQLRAVKYLNEPLNLDDKHRIYHISDEDTRLDYLAIDYAKYSDRFFQCIHLVKNKQMWQEENEWRMIVGNQRGKAKPHSGGGGLLLKIDPSCYKSLFIGFKVDGTIKLLLRDIANAYGIQSYVITPEIVDNKWDMSIIPFK